MKSKHTHYVYHVENRVYARLEGRPPLLAKTCETAQDAADFVQEIVNPKGLRHDDKSLGGVGFHHPSFVDAISDNCREFVEATYAADSIPDNK